MLAELGDDKTLWINVHMNSKTRAGYSSVNSKLWNDLLAQKNVRVFDWNAVVAVFPEWLSADGIHYTAEGSRWRAEWIAYASSLSLK